VLVVERGLIAYLFIKKQEKPSSINNCGVHPVIYNEDYVCKILHGTLVKDVMLRNFVDRTKLPMKSWPEI